MHTHADVIPPLEGNLIITKVVTKTHILRVGVVYLTWTSCACTRRGYKKPGLVCSNRIEFVRAGEL